MGTDSGLGEIALEKILAVTGRFHQEQQDSAFRARSWVYFSSFYSGAVRPAAQFTCYIAECNITGLPIIKHWKGEYQTETQNKREAQSDIL